jgi:DNA primase
MAGSIPRTFIDDLLTRIDIVDVIDSRVTLKKSGKSYKACCPFHNEKTPSFTVSAEKQFYHCFGCGASGSAIRFLMDYEHMEFVEAVEDLAKMAGVEVPYEGRVRPQINTSKLYELHELMEQVSQFYVTELASNKDKSVAIDYLKQRGLTGQTVKLFDLGFAPSGWDNLLRKFGSNPSTVKQLVDTGMVITNDKGKTYDRFRERIMFPIRDRRGRVIAFGGRIIGEGTPKYLNSPETEIFHKSYELYGLNSVIKSGSAKDTILVVEGYMDVVSLANRGVNNAVATLGTAITEQHVQVLVKQSNIIVYCFDGDAAGKKAAWRALETSLSYLQKGVQFKFMFLPDGEDPDTMVSQLGADRFNALVNQAKPLSEFMLERLLEQADYRTIDGQANLIEKAKPLISKLPKGGFVNLMVGRLAKYVQMPEEALMQQLKGSDGVRSQSGVNTPAMSSSGPNAQFSHSSAKNRSIKKLQIEKPSTIKLAIAMLLEKPSLALLVENPGELKTLLLPGVVLLHDLLVFIQSNPNITTGGLLERWRSTEEGRFLPKILSWEHHVPESGFESEFLASIDALKRQLKDQMLDELLNRSKTSPLSAEDKKKLSQLMAERVN